MYCSLRCPGTVECPGAAFFFYGPVNGGFAVPGTSRKLVMTSSQLPLEISCHDVKTRLDRGDDVLLLDCRELNEFQLVRIEGARLLPMSEIAGRVGEIAEFQGRPVHVYCHHGGRSLQVASWLRQQGFPLAQSMSGGIDDWALQIEPGMKRY